MWVLVLRSVLLSGRGRTLACDFLRPMMWEPVYRCDRHQAWAKSLGFSGGLDRMGSQGPKAVGEGNLSLRNFQLEKFKWFTRFGWVYTCKYYCVIFFMC